MWTAHFDSPLLAAMGARWLEIFLSFLKLGCTSFGGPVAHLGYLRDEFVAKRAWLADDEYADTVALCQFLPGPASSQVVFALGQKRGGIVGALIASLCFSMPSAILMIAFAYGVSALGDLEHAGWLHGLKLAATAVVAQAVWNMGRKLCPDPARVAIALAVSAAALLIGSASMQIALILTGALIGWAVYKKSVPASSSAAAAPETSHRWAAAALITFGALLLILPWISQVTQSLRWSEFSRFYRTGSLVFGGGHVILPLLRAEFVPPGLISEGRFLAGYGAAQALPGPLFTFAAFLGTSMSTSSHAWVDGLRCLFGIYLPTWLLVAGALPYWHLLKTKAWCRAALYGANAAVVGILLAALYNPVFKESVNSVGDLAVVVIALTALQRWKTPPWLVVIAIALIEQAVRVSLPGT